MLGTVDVSKGYTQIGITGISESDVLNIGAIALIPTEQIADEKPVNPVNPDKPSKSGCGGSIALTASLMSVMALGAMAFLSIKRRKED